MTIEGGSGGGLAAGKTGASAAGHRDLGAGAAAPPRS